jgi:ParB family chromosome partitioning protein
MTMAQKGLGKGLSALISENSASITQSSAASDRSANGTNGITQLALTHLAPGKYQPRTHFDEGTLTELAESIEKNGVMQPIIVRPVGGQTHRFEIIAGERRWRAAKIAGLQTIPAIVRELTDKQALELALVENVQRQDLSPLEEANGYQRLIEEFDYTQDELATIVGKSRSHIGNLLRLLSLPDDVRQMLDSGAITVGHARALLSCSDASLLAQEIVKRGLNVRQAEEIGRMMQGKDKRHTPRASSPQSTPRQNAPREKDADILALEESLSENLGLRVSIHDRGQSGEIMIAYDNLAQLDVILRKLGSNAEELV